MITFAPILTIVCTICGLTSTVALYCAAAEVSRMVHHDCDHERRTMLGVILRSAFPLLDPIPLGFAALLAMLV